MSVKKLFKAYNYLFSYLYKTGSRIQSEFNILLYHQDEPRPSPDHARACVSRLKVCGLKFQVENLQIGPKLVENLGVIKVRADTNKETKACGIQ